MIEFTESTDGFYLPGDRMIFDGGTEDAYIQRGVAKYVDPLNLTKRGPGRPPKQDKMLRNEQIQTK